MCFSIFNFVGWYVINFVDLLVVKFEVIVVIVCLWVDFFVRFKIIVKDQILLAIVGLGEINHFINVFDFMVVINFEAIIRGGFNFIINVEIDYLIKVFISYLLIFMDVS